VPLEDEAAVAVPREWRQGAGGAESLKEARLAPAEGWLTAQAVGAAERRVCGAIGGDPLHLFPGYDDDGAGGCVVDDDRPIGVGDQVETGPGGQHRRGAAVERGVQGAGGQRPREQATAALEGSDGRA